MVTSEFRGRVELDERENLSPASLKIEKEKTQNPLRYDFLRSSIFGSFGIKRPSNLRGDSI